jgi:hypothetical protein
MNNNFSCCQGASSSRQTFILKKEKPKIIDDFFRKRRLLIEQKNKLPPASTLVRNLGNSLLEEAQSILKQNPKITKEQTEQRINICQECEFFIRESSRCQKCGCFLKWKTAWRSQKCPIGKW